MNLALKMRVRGALATVPMTLAMAGVRRNVPGRGRLLPPRLVARGIAGKLGLRGHLDEREKSIMSWTSHFSYGGALAVPFAFYTSLRARARKGPPPIWAGALYGAAVWALGYLGWLPALRILPLPKDWSKKRNLMTFLPHLVWGASLSVLSREKLGDTRHASRRRAA